MSVKKIILLTSKDNFIWTSMQEIIPMLESLWTQYCLKYNYQLVTIDVDHSTPASYMKDLIESDVIVVTCFNLKISRFLQITRKKFQIDTRIFFYLHGLATIALWPLHRFDLLPLLTSNDVFIGTCEGDINALSISIINAIGVKIPFTINDFDFSKPASQSQTGPLVYIGRISPQKNLTTLINAYSKLEPEFRKKHPLYLYGQEDHLGYPNIGVSEVNYQEDLQLLVKTNNLSEDVLFKGFVNRDEIQKILGSNFVFISCSTHSDENFGMAAFRSLLSGAVCILTRWGGHKEFKSTFNESVHYIDPVLNTDEISKTIKNIMHLKAVAVGSTPPDYSRETLLSKMDEIVNLTNIATELQPTPLALSVYQQQADFEKTGQVQRCFKSIDDPAFISYFQAYL